MKKSFIQVSKAWYNTSYLNEKDLLDEAIIFISDDENNMMSEFVVEFHSFGNSPSARICVFDDAIDALIDCNDMVVQMDNHKNWRPQEFFDMLVNLGYKDATPIVADKGNQVKLELVKEQLGPMVEQLANGLDWSQIAGTVIAVGLFVKNGEFFVAGIGAGAPDENRLIGAVIYGTSSISINDETPDHYETADMLLADNVDRFLDALAPNHMKVGR